MLRGASTSPSEGEIVESGSEKANTSIYANKSISVDPQTRKRTSISRSPSPYRSTRSRLAVDISRDRSRSPYRETKGLKRQHDGNHYKQPGSDPRHFKAHYEEAVASERERGRSAPRESHQRGGSDHRYLRNDDRLNDVRRKAGHVWKDCSPKRSIDLYSRYREDSSRHYRSDAHSHDNGVRNIPQGHKNMYSGEQSVSNRSRAPVSSTISNDEAKIIEIQAQTHGNNSPIVDDTQAAKYVPPCNITLDPDFCEPSGILISKENQSEEHIIQSQPQLDEAALIEERRRKREAIKARHRGQATPLLVQTLVIGDKSDQVELFPAQDKSTDTSAPPKTEHVPIYSTKPLSTTTGEVSERPNSPTHSTVRKDADLANENVTIDATGDDEPSAADYDPQMDMQESKLRYNPSRCDDKVQPSTERRTKQLTTDIQKPTKAEGEPNKSRPDEFDMFDESDSMDMFAEPSTKTSAAKKQDVEAATAQSQAIDMSMLDDWDDHEGYYKVKLGELLDGRYHLQSNLGKGMFSGVVRAIDQRTKRLVAIKIVRNNETMHKAGQKEIGILKTLRNADLEDKKHLIRLERSFEHKGHLCMVFENLSINLREVLKKFGRDVGINLKAVRAYAQQMFLGLSLLKKCNILHADLKPDNVLVNEARNTLKICDLGSASDASDNEITQYLVSRFYRAPEIILGLPYDFAIDMWSIGCTLFELYTGKILFTGRSNNQMLRVIMECRGKFSQKVLRKAHFTGFHFDDLLNFRSIENDRLNGRDTIRLMNFTKPTRDLRTRLIANSNGMSDIEVKELNLFIDLLDRCLNLNAEKRCTPTEALKHPFITRQKG